MNPNTNPNGRTMRNIRIQRDRNEARKCREIAQRRIEDGMPGLAARYLETAKRIDKRADNLEAGRPA